MGRALSSAAGAALQADMPHCATGGAVALHHPVVEPSRA